MLTAIVLANSQEKQGFAREAAEQAARTLAFLVSAAVQGLVRDAVLVGEDSAALRYVADYAGCTLVTESDPAAALVAALSSGRAEHVFLLTAGYAAEPPLIDEIRDFLEFSGGRDTLCGLVRQTPRGLAQRLLPVISPLAGLVAPRVRSRDAGARDLADMARRLRPKVTFKAGARRLVY
ncbi:MAG: transposase [Methylobacteriaceae bacterium]|nr:transposase [Methylobacteriaceae bacterium]